MVPQHKVRPTLGVLDTCFILLLLLLLQVRCVLLLLLLLLLLLGQQLGLAALLQVPDSLCKGSIYYA